MASIALVVDSTALLPPDVVARTGALVVPVTVTVDGVDYEDDGVALTPDGFFALLDRPEPPSVATSQPSPGRFLAAYREAASRGADAVVAVVVGSAFSGTCDSARVAAASSPIPVQVVDSGQASFGVGLCAIAASEAIEAGADVAAAAMAAERRAAGISSIFIVQALDLAQASGRFSLPLSATASDNGRVAGDSDGSAESASIPVLRFADGELTVVREVRTVSEAVDAMSEAILEGSGPRRVASGLADLATKPVTAALEERLELSPLVVDLIRYRVGPGVAANVGPGTAGVFVHPLP